MWHCTCCFATVEQYFDFVHEIEDDVISFEEKHGDEKGRRYFRENVRLKKRVLRVKRVIVPMEELTDKFKSRMSTSAVNRVRAFEKIEAKSTVSS